MEPEGSISMLRSSKRQGRGTGGCRRPRARDDLSCSSRP